MGRFIRIKSSRVKIFKNNPYTYVLTCLTSSLILSFFVFIIFFFFFFLVCYFLFKGKINSAVRRRFSIGDNNLNTHN